MRIKVVFAAALLTVLPGIALAQGCMYGHDERVTMSCADGTTWDADSMTCVATVSS